jgi:hypothetical protein
MSDKDRNDAEPTEDVEAHTTTTTTETDPDVEGHTTTTTTPGTTTTT